MNKYLNLKTANDKRILMPICIDCANGIKKETSVRVHKQMAATAQFCKTNNDLRVINI